MSNHNLDYINLKEKKENLGLKLKMIYKHDINLDDIDITNKKEILNAEQQFIQKEKRDAYIKKIIEIKKIINKELEFNKINNNIEEICPANDFNYLINYISKLFR